MYKVFIFMILSFAIVSCTQNEMFDKSNEIIGGGDRLVIKLTPAEYFSIAFDGENELSDEDAEIIFKEFLVSGNVTRGSLADLNFSINEHYYLETSASDLSVRSAKSQSEIKLVEFKINSKTRSNENEEDGFALVVADNRFPNVIAFAEKGNIENADRNGAGLMIQRAKNVAANYISAIVKYQDSLRTETIDKIEKYITEPYSFEKVKDALFIEKAETRVSADPNPPGTPLATIGPLINVRWIQGFPQNQFIQKCSPEDLVYWPEISYGGRYPAGCTAVAVATALSYFKPTIYSNDLGRYVNWTTALSNPIIYPWDFADDEYVKEAAAILKEVATGIKTTYGPGGGSANMNDASAYMKKLGISIDGRTELSYLTVRPSIGQYRPVILTGTARRVRSSTRAETSGSHAWVMDGLKIMIRPSSHVGPQTELKYYNNYGWCNFGWAFSAYNGWYLFDNDGSIEFDCGSDRYDIDLAAYPNIRR